MYAMYTSTIEDTQSVSGQVLVVYYKLTVSIFIVNTRWEESNGIVLMKVKIKLNYQHMAVPTQVCLMGKICPRKLKIQCSKNTIQPLTSCIL